MKKLLSRRVGNSDRNRVSLPVAFLVPFFWEFPVVVLLKAVCLPVTKKWR